MRILIIERVDDEFYSYFEDPDHYALLLHNGQRDFENHVDVDDFADSCSLNDLLANGNWTSFIFN